MVHLGGRWSVADGFAGAVTRSSWGPLGLRSCPAHRGAWLRPGSIGRFPSAGDCTQPGPYTRPRVWSLSVIQSVKCKWFTLIGPPLPRGPPSPLSPAPPRSHRCYLLPSGPLPPTWPSPSFSPVPHSPALPLVSFSHPEGPGRTVRFLLMTRGHHGLARPFVAPMSATSRPRSDTWFACVRAYGNMCAG